MAGRVAGRPPALVLSGGVALGAFQGGAYAAMDAAGWRPDWVVGTSIGAVTAALIAGGPAAGAVERLRAFWAGAAGEPGVFVPPSVFGTAARGSLWAALGVQGWGQPGVFLPRVPGVGPDERPSLYHLEPLRARLEELVDFAALNSGAVRVTVTATDLESGERVVFDTDAGVAIGVEHLLASCGFTPLFPPVAIGGRLLGDGGLSANLAADLVLDAPDGHGVCVAVDLFAPEGARPRSVRGAASRVTDLVFGNQSRMVLERCAREGELRRAVARLGALLPEAVRGDPALAAVLALGAAEEVEVVRVVFRPDAGEAEAEKVFDFSARSLAARWAEGAAAMGAAMAERGVGGE